MKTVELTDPEERALVIWLNIELRNEKLTFKYDQTLNSIYFKLTGENHESWERRQSQLQEDDR